LKSPCSICVGPAQSGRTVASAATRGSDFAEQSHRLVQPGKGTTHRRRISASRRVGSVACRVLIAGDEAPPPVVVIERRDEPSVERHGTTDLVVECGELSDRVHSRANRVRVDDRRVVKLDDDSFTRTVNHEHARLVAADNLPDTHRTDQLRHPIGHVHGPQPRRTVTHPAACRG
jgi:hypothetical protein